MHVSNESGDEVSMHENTVEPNQNVQLIDADRGSVTRQPGALQDLPDRDVLF
jgi:hypothetical protein